MTRISSDMFESPRRTDRVQISISLEVMGTDLATGRPFCQRGCTSAVSRNGAAIVLNYALSTYQELTIRCLSTNKEAEARVVGLISGPDHELVYGVALLSTAENLWGIDFPTLTGDEGFGRVLLQCRVCQSYRVVHLNEIEVQVFETNQGIHQFCKACSATTSWRRPASEALPESSLPREQAEQESTAQPSHAANKRKHGRIRTNVAACIREPGFPEEIVSCENLSRGGIRIRTPKLYQKGTRIEVAVPYSTGSGNIFVPAQIVHVQHCGEFYRLGVAYVGISEKRQHAEGYSGSALFPDITNH
jgi:hypothetical protein